MNIYNFFINTCHYTLLAPQIPGNFSIFCSPENMLDTTLNLDMSSRGSFRIWQQTPAIGLVWFSNRWNCGEQIQTSYLQISVKMYALIYNNIKKNIPINKTGFIPSRNSQSKGSNFLLICKCHNKIFLRTEVKQQR